MMKELQEEKNIFPEYLRRLALCVKYIYRCCLHFASKTIEMLELK